MKRFLLPMPLLLVLGAGAGCDSDKTALSPGVTVSGSVDADVQGEGRAVAIIWQVSSGSPDYAYKFGEGIITNGRFSITLAGDPPAEAVNSFGLGVGMVVLPAPGTTWPDGRLTRELLRDPAILGISARSSIIWRAKTMNLPSGTPPPGWWPPTFPPGLSCGVCTPKPDGGSFEGFAPGPCDQFRVTTFDRTAVCNWT